MTEQTYIQVILPLKLEWEPYYRSTGTELEVGDRVSVIFARKRYIAVVSAVGVRPDLDEKRIQDISGVEPHMEKITAKELELWRFISSYYLCTVGEVYHLAYPATRTAGEEAKAHREEKKEERLRKKLEALQQKLDKLHARLVKKEMELQGRHNESVTARLEAELGRIKSEIDAAAEDMDVLQSQGQEAEDAPMAQDMRQLECGEEAMKVLAMFKEGRTVLLNGGPSRIEVMMQLASETLQKGMDVLLIVPDISLSRHLQDRLQTAFADKLRIFHSGSTAADRRETATRLRQGGGNFILGTRSAIFLPYTKLGLVMVEEEHDSWYKEQDRSPRYNGRDTAVMLGALHGADVLLSSPTPSLESIANCYTGRYGTVDLPASDSLMELIDTSEEYKKRGMVGSLSRLLMQAVGEALESGGNILILRPWGPADDLRDELHGHWPEAVETGQIRACTTYEAKRMDLSCISLLAIIQADILLERQDFRADERAIQALEQFRGRLEGRMLIQTRQSTHQVFAKDKDLIQHLLSERKAFGFPPYTRLLDVVVVDANEARLQKLSTELGNALQCFRSIGPYKPVMGKNPVEGVRHIRITLKKDSSLRDEKRKIAEIISDFEKDRKYTGHIHLDVDPA